MILNVLGPGDFFGEIALLDGKGRTATAVARDACRLLFFARKEFISFFGDRPEAMSRIIELLCAGCGGPPNTLPTLPSSIFPGGWPSSWSN